MVLQQSLPASARAYSRAQRSEITDAVAAVGRLWRRVGTDFDTGWARVGPQMLSVTAIAQARVSAGALEYVPDVLEDTGQVGAIDAVATARTAPLIGAAGDGRPVESLLYGAVVRTKELVGRGQPAFAALQSSGKWLSSTTGTLLSDTARNAESLRAGVSRQPVTGYVRMLQTPSCPRCVILAGKWFKRNQGFQRHPGCDCRHIPSSEAVGGDLTIDPQEYVASLSDDELDSWIGKPNADALREGADLNQVVNAQRGMRTAQIGGRSVLVTNEGVTRRGFAYQRLRFANDPASLRRRPRLMPESIARIAKNRDDYLRLLRANGYLI
jgi:hypothetical protein